jgi:hypothetical protein
MDSAKSLAAINCTKPSAKTRAWRTDSVPPSTEQVMREQTCPRSVNSTRPTDFGLHRDHFPNFSEMPDHADVGSLAAPQDLRTPRCHASAEHLALKNLHA